MWYYLMHKDTHVAKVDIREGHMLVSLAVSKRITDYPAGVYCAGELRSDLLKSWWHGRCAPADAYSGMRVDGIELPPVGVLLETSLGLSLSDYYWVKPCYTSALSWADVSFYCNPRPDALGELRLRGKTSHPVHRLSPSVSLDGAAKRAWVLHSSGYVLYDSLSCFPRVFLSMLCAELGLVGYASYFLHEGYVCSSCLGSADSEYRSLNLPDLRAANDVFCVDAVGSDVYRVLCFLSFLLGNDSLVRGVGVIQDTVGMGMIVLCGGHMSFADTLFSLSVMSLPVSCFPLVSLSVLESIYSYLVTYIKAYDSLVIDSVDLVFRTIVSRLRVSGLLVS